MIRRLFVAALLALLPGVAWAQVSGGATVSLNPTATLTLPATTTAYAAGSLIANSATAASVVIPTIAAAPIIVRAALRTNDATATAWGGQQVRVDLWSAAPTFTNGDRGAWAVATGMGHWLGSMTCTMGTEQGDGAAAACSPDVGSAILLSLPGGALYWTLDAVSGSGVTGASGVFTLRLEESN